MGAKTNLDKIYDTWENIEQVYQKKGNGATRYDFLVRMIGSPNSLVNLRSMIDKDFVSTQENIQKLNTLFSILERAQKRLSTATEIENLDTFVWAISTDSENSTAIDIQDFQVVRYPKYEDDEQLCKKGMFASVYRLGSDSKVQAILKDPESFEFIRFHRIEDAVFFINQYNDTTDYFLRSVILYVLSQSKKRLEFPMVFSHVLPDNYKEERKLNEDLVYKKFDGSKAPFHLQASVGYVRSIIGIERFVYIE